MFYMAFMSYNCTRITNKLICSNFSERKEHVYTCAKKDWTTGEDRS